MRMRRGGAWASVVLVVLGALVVSLTASITRGDTALAVGSWVIYLVCAALGTGVALLGARVWRRVSHRPARTTRRAIFVTSLLVAAVSFPVEATWEEDLGGRAHGLVPAAQALAFKVWPRSDWGAGDRPRGPLLGYAYTCCS